ncbi:hypothetical protein POSPLADRAFT_1131808 [Postia placenta MAD-698-R-SB12]|uniref:Amidase domain-containing protein n=1 Tax=Postia placenta MAD-698-R-SB12 TaxID=670580 RepID=A0A1X6NBX4_9APHY|nr:hypothetical protein POSPLADRAFT_1131808 [Postia placenta MAD-698-R-SB12]OSX66101.1 hypothetical protein POSPLADRAFT_1131808 [Postia placenta MAD-698-R-SB12]
MAQIWKRLVADKRRRQLESIPKDWLIQVPDEHIVDVTAVPERCGLLSDRELQITNTGDVNEILDKLAKGEWSAVEVTNAFCKRAIIAHQLVNCLTEIFVEKALARAAELDDYLKTTGKTIGPLHGLPVSLKDQFSIKGLEATMGYASYVGRFAQQDAALVEILHECGAIPYVKTNLPQTLLWVETHNLLFGRTVNPINRKLTSGGSSGGECALIALRGSPLGVGTDLGGSIRIPSAYNGLYGFKPSSYRLPHQGCVTSLDGLDSMLSAVGPISHSLSGIKTFLKAVIGREPWLKDPQVVPKKWDEDEYALIRHGGGKRLCFAIMWNDGVVRPHTPIVRALKMVKGALAAAGHVGRYVVVVDWQPYKHAEFGDIMNGIWRAGSGAELKAATEATGEPLLSSLGLEEQPPGKAFFATGEGISAYDLWQLQKAKTQLRKEYLDHWQNTVSVTGTGRPVDAIIGPASASAATPHGMNRYTNYTRVWNALDYVAAVFPVTKVDPVDQSYYAKHMSGMSGFLCIECAAKTFLCADDPDTFLGAPVGLQIVGRTLEEEAVLRMMEIVDGVLKNATGSRL